VNSKKEKLRKELITQRLALSKVQVEAKTQIIIKKLIDSVDWNKVKKVHIYTALTPLNEVDTTGLWDYISDNWPHINLSTSPARKDAPIPEEQFDLIIVPVLGFGKDNYRLGMGGGWYDRFLSQQNNAITIGLSYREFYKVYLPRESHDVALTKILTD
jgi:5-formyltetrahydrofolate cyclo-ligase